MRVQFFYNFFFLETLSDKEKSFVVVRIVFGTHEKAEQSDDLRSQKNKDRTQQFGWLINWKRKEIPQATSHAAKRS